MKMWQMFWLAAVMYQVNREKRMTYIYYAASFLSLFVEPAVEILMRRYPYPWF